MHNLLVRFLSAFALTACADAAGLDELSTDPIDAASPTSAPLARADAGDLSADQARSVLFELDQICGDTWCAGDFDFAFARVTCQFARATCTVTLRIWPRQATRPIPLYWRSCKLAGLHAFADLVDTAPTGYRSIDPAFYAKMTTCTTSLIAKLPPPT